MAEPLYWCCAETLMFAVRLPLLRSLPPVLELRQRLLTALDAMVGQGRADGIADADLAEARYALTAFVDEQVLKSNWPGREEWMRRTLQHELYADGRAGENFFNRLRMLLQQGRVCPAVEAYYLCLLLGFRGAFGDEATKNQAYLSFCEAARQRVAQAWPGSSKLGPHAEPADRVQARRRSRAPLVAVMVGSLLLALTVLVVLERLVNADLGRTLQVVREAEAVMAR